MTPEILFISRNYPPQIGGLEAHSYHLIKSVGQSRSVSKIVLGKPRRHLSWFLPYATLKAFCLIKKENIPRVHLCDGLLAPVGVLLKAFLPVRVSVTIHGLDITFRNSFYQSLIPRCVSRLDKIICVSRHTQSECVARGVPAEKIHIVPNGIDPEDLEVSQTREMCRAKAADRLGLSLEGKKILLTVGRLVPRKGVAWFVQEVMARLDDRYCYVIVGEGRDVEKISSVARHGHLEDRVFMLGQVSKETRNNLLHASDLFIMPNVNLEGDVEGFGIAALEAGCCGLPVIASDLQGLKDAVLHGRTGFLVETGNAGAFLEKIRNMDLKREAVRSLVVGTFGWGEVSKRYEEFLGLLPGTGRILPHE